MARLALIPCIFFYCSKFYIKELSIIISNLKEICFKLHLEITLL